MARRQSQTMLRACFESTHVCVAHTYSIANHTLLRDHNMEERTDRETGGVSARCYMVLHACHLPRLWRGIAAHSLPFVQRHTVVLCISQVGFSSAVGFSYVVPTAFFFNVLRCGGSKQRAQKPPLEKVYSSKLIT